MSSMLAELRGMKRMRQDRGVVRALISGRHWIVAMILLLLRYLSDTTL